MAEFSMVPVATEYQPKNAYSLALCAELAYQDEAPIQAKTASWGLSNFKFIDSGLSTQVFVAGNDELVIVAYRGTEDVTDFIADIRALQVDGPWGKVHKGFSKALDRVFDEVAATIESFRSGGQSLWICGHSLGAALATLTAAQLKTQDTAINGIYTYGEPRSGDPDFARHYEAALKERHFRFANNNDAVTRIPWEQFQFQDIELEYSHVGQFIYITTRKTLSDDIGTWGLRADRALGRIQAGATGDFFDGVTDHAIAEYIKALELNIDNNPFAD